jgi:hypothetical protein
MRTTAAPQKITATSLPVAAPPTAAIAAQSTAATPSPTAVKA